MKSEQEGGGTNGGGGLHFLVENNWRETKHTIKEGEAILYYTIEY